MNWRAGKVKMRMKMKVPKRKGRDTQKTWSSRPTLLPELEMHHGRKSAKTPSLAKRPYTRVTGYPHDPKIFRTVYKSHITAKGLTGTFLGTSP